jgi:predicted nucleic acid-binding protein
MASITIRNLDDTIKEQLRIAAAHNGHSMKEEVRLILGRALATVDRAGGARLPYGKRKQKIEAHAMAMFEEDFAGRILPFDVHAAVEYATLVAGCEAQGRAASMADAQIAAICRTHGAPIATRNVRDFELPGIEVINPWEA